MTSPLWLTPGDTRHECHIKSKLYHYNRWCCLHCIEYTDAWTVTDILHELESNNLYILTCKVALYSTFMIAYSLLFCILNCVFSEGWGEWAIELELWPFKITLIVWQILSRKWFSCDACKGGEESPTEIYRNHMHVVLHSCLSHMYNNVTIKNTFTAALKKTEFTYTNIFNTLWINYNGST